LKKNVSSLSNRDKSFEQSVEAKNEEKSVASNEDNDAVKIGSLFAKWQTDKQKGIKYDNDDDDESRSRMSRTSSASTKSNTKAKDSIGNLKRKAEKSEQAEKPSELDNYDEDDKKNSSGGREALKTSRKATQLDDNEDRLNKASTSRLEKEAAAKYSTTKAQDKKLKTESEETQVNKTSEKANEKSAPTEANKTKNASTIFKSVVFVLSGFQNPERSDLRNKAIELGAKYKPDWDKECTHLICAFANTPKFNEVSKLGGTIVSKDWILDCYKNKKLLDAKKYALVSEDSEDSEDDAKVKRKERASSKKAKVRLDKLSEDEEDSDDREFVVGDSEEDIEYAPSDSSDKEAEKSESESSASESGDEDDHRKKSKTKKKKVKKSKVKSTKRKMKTSGSSEDDVDSDMEDTKKKTKLAKYERKEVETKNKLSSRRKISTSSSSSSDKEESSSKTSAYSKDAIKPQTSTSAKESNNKSTNNNINNTNNNGNTKTKKEIVYSDSDSDEEKVNKKEASKELPKQLARKKEASSSSTDINSDMAEENFDAKEPWELPDLFADKNFYIYGNFSAREIKLFNRIIIAFAGSVHNYTSDKIDFVITDHDWNEEFDNSLKANPKLKFVTSDWLDACATRKRLIAVEPFEVKPSHV